MSTNPAPTTNRPAIETQRLTHNYGARCALDHLDLKASPSEIFAVVGPNGGGKTTLFRILSTLMLPSAGEARVAGYDVCRERMAIRHKIGVVFQTCSVDGKLTVDENLAQQGHLYGLRGTAFRRRRDEVLQRLGVDDRRSEWVETLSGGLRRRVDLAKALLHHPDILLLDEPSTGLDPGARIDLWKYLRSLRDEKGMTIVLTTHLLDEAERADQLTIIHQGRIVASGAPASLRNQLGGNSITVETETPELLCSQINARWPCGASVIDGLVRIQGTDDEQLSSAQLIEAFPGQIQSVKWGRPTLEDVFIEKTGHRFWQHESAS